MQISGNNPLYFKGNQIAISSGPFYVSVRLINANPPYFCLQIIDENRKQKEFSFWTLEEAIYFKNKIDNYRTLDQVESLYNKLLLASKEINDSPSVRIYDNRISLSVDDIKETIINYYRTGTNSRYDVEEQLSIKDGALFIQFFISRYFDDEPEEKIYTRELKPDELRSIFNDLIKYENYELDNFQCIGGINNNLGNDTPYFEGIELYLRERVKPLRLNMSKQTEFDEQ